MIEENKAKGQGSFESALTYPKTQARPTQIGWVGGVRGGNVKELHLNTNTTLDLPQKSKGEVLVLSDKANNASKNNT